jgi:hypothetical protein
MNLSRFQFTTGILFGFIAALAVTSPANAQGVVQKNAMEKAHFYQSQREIQIVDDRPVIKDFRQAPAAEDLVALPPPPPGWNGGSGAGALGNVNTLPRVSFSTNLPRGVFCNHVPVAAKAKPARGNLLRPAAAAAPAAPQVAQRTAPPVVASYGGYGGGSSGQSTTRTNSKVRGTLLRH